jgi:hypothetical protein
MAFGTTPGNEFFVSWALCKNHTSTFTFTTTSTSTSTSTSTPPPAQHQQFQPLTKQNKRAEDVLRAWLRYRRYHFLGLPESLV